MAQMYTTEEVYKKLGITQATLYRWLKKAKEDGCAEQVKPRAGVDKRERLYTLAQLKWLAKRYGVELLPDEAAYVAAPQSMNALKQEIVQLRHLLEEMRAEVAQLREEFEQHKVAAHPPAPSVVDSTAVDPSRKGL